MTGHQNQYLEYREFVVVEFFQLGSVPLFVEGHADQTHLFVSKLFVLTSDLDEAGIQKAQHGGFRRPPRLISKNDIPPRARPLSGLWVRFAADRPFGVTRYLEGVRRMVLQIRSDVSKRKTEPLQISEQNDEGQGGSRIKGLCRSPYPLLCSSRNQPLPLPEFEVSLASMCRSFSRARSSSRSRSTLGSGASGGFQSSQVS